MTDDKNKVYYLVHVIYIDNTEGNIVINSSIINLLKRFKDKIVVRNFWPITKEEYESYDC